MVVDRVDGGGGGNIINGEPNMNTMKSSPANGPGTPREEGNMGEFGNMGGFGNNGENVSMSFISRQSDTLDIYHVPSPYDY